MRQLEPGDPATIGPYKLLGRLGSGGMGRVYLAVSAGGRAIAVKVIRPDLVADDGFRARFRAEVGAARRVGGAYTTPVVDADPDGPMPWLATAYVNGPSLQEIVERFGPMPENILRSLGAGLAEALSAVHAAGLIHRDLKPGNVLLADDGPRVIDFGISRAADGTLITEDGQVIGSAGYMSPEQAAGRELTPAADVFSLGAVLAFAATGRPPFGTGPGRTRVYRVAHEPPDLAGTPPTLAGLIAACLDKDPARRPPVDRLPGLMSAPPLPPGWLPEPIRNEQHDRETTLFRDIGSLRNPAKTRRQVLGVGALVVLAAAGGTAARLLTRQGPAGAPRLAWRAKLPDAMVPHHIVGDTLWCGTESDIFVADAPNAVAAYDLRTGKAHWNDAAAKDTATPAGVGTLAFAIRAGRIHALTAASGATVWKSRPDHKATSIQTVTKTSLFAGTSDHTMLAMEAKTGRVKWTYRAPAGMFWQPVIGVLGTSLLFGISDHNGKNQHFIGLDIASGKQLFDRPYPDTDPDWPYLPGTGSLCFGVGPDTITAIDVTTGHTAWARSLPAASDDLHLANAGALSLMGDTLYVLGQSVHALDAATGTQRWQYVSASSVKPTGWPTPGGLYLYDQDSIGAFDPASGERQWTVPAPTPIKPGFGSPPVVLTATARMVVAGVVAGNGSGLYGWDTTTGKRVWAYPFTNVDAGGDVWTFVGGNGYLIANYTTTMLAFTLPTSDGAYQSSS